MSSRKITGMILAIQVLPQTKSLFIYSILKMSSYEMTHLLSPLKSNSSYCNVISFISFWIFKIRRDGSQCNYTSARIYIILENSNTLHELFFLSKVPCLSIILSFRIKRVLSKEEHRTMVYVFVFKHKADHFRFLLKQFSGSNFPHLITILALQVDIYQLMIFPPKSFTFHPSHTFQGS